MKTDAQKYLMRIERTQLLLTKIAENNESAKWEDSDDPVAGIIEWAEQNGFNPQAELYFKGRQAGRVALARQALEVLGRLLEPDEGGPAIVEWLRRMSPELDIIQCENVLQAADKIERLREALRKISNSDTCGCQMECVDMCKIASAALKGDE